MLKPSQFSLLQLMLAATLIAVYAAIIRYYAGTCPPYFNYVELCLPGLYRGAFPIVGGLIGLGLNSTKGMLVGIVVGLIFRLSL